MPKILICDDDPIFLMTVKYALKGRYECLSSKNAEEALAILKNKKIDLLLLDVQMRTPEEGLEYLPRLKETDPELVIIMSSGLTDFHTVKEAMRLGAQDYVPKDFEANEFIHKVEMALETNLLRRRHRQKNFEALESQKRHLLIGESPSILALRRTIEKLRAVNANVVITGETGTGKEVVARQLRGVLEDGTLAPFVAVDSSTIQSSTAESLLFGHEKGAFTGADRTTQGIFEEAHGGIVYFDEIANMPLEIQAKLLRILQEKEIVRLGSNKVLPVEFRVICATNRSLDQMVNEGTFKEDLLQRINVIPIELPPLRERTEDIPLLVEHFIFKQGTSIRFTDDAIQALQSYRWPGNIRELGNVVSYTIAMSESPEIDASDLPPKIRDGIRLAHMKSGAGSFYDQVSKLEKEILERELARAGGNISKMAISLEMDRSHLYTKLREHGIHRPGK